MSIRIDPDVEAAIAQNEKAGSWINPILPGWIRALQDQQNVSQTVDAGQTFIKDQLS